MAIRVGLIGADYIGATFTYHLKNRVADAELLAIADAHGKTAGEVADRFCVECIYNSYRRLLENNNFDALVIASPTNTHPEIFQAIINAHKHIFCEKPLALTLEDCDRAIAAVDAAGEKLKLGFMCRFGHEPGLSRIGSQLLPARMAAIPMAATRSFDEDRPVRSVKGNDERKEDNGRKKSTSPPFR